MSKNRYFIRKGGGTRLNWSHKFHSWESIKDIVTQLCIVNGAQTGFCDLTERNFAWGIGENKGVLDFDPY